MQLFMNLPDESQQLNQTQFPLKLHYHAPKGRFKIIHQGLMIPNLPAPLHYLNFVSLIGQPNLPILRNVAALHESALDTVTLMSSISPHMVGHLNDYSLEKECIFSEGLFQFGTREKITGYFPQFHLERHDAELSYDLEIYTHPIVSHFSKLGLGLFEYWSLMCECQGQIRYQDQIFDIQQLGTFEYARAINVPYLPVHFFTYQIINLNQQRQLLLVHIRNNFNQIVQSRLYLRDLIKGSAEMFDTDVHFKIHRVYPKVTTPNQQEMYLPREFAWSWQQGERSIIVYAQSRGDFKFGFAAGYAGSFKYQVTIDGVEEEGEAGYCEYIDCRPLRWQENNFQEKNLSELAYPSVFALKNKQNH